MQLSNQDLMRRRIKKVQTSFLLIVGIIALLELAFIVRGLFFFNLARLKHRLYLYSYLFLFAASAITFLTLLLCGRRERHFKKITRLSYFYAAALFCWSTFVSILDCVAEGDSAAMVLVMTTMAVGVLLLIKPVIFATMIVASVSVLIVCCSLWREVSLSTGFYTNFAIFATLAIFMNFHNYRLSWREYLGEKKLEKLSYTDQLTAVFNRRQLDLQVADYASVGHAYTFLLLDIDDFKRINDTQGHPVGDVCLIRTAHELTSAFGQNVYRFGGDEFAIITDLPCEEAGQVIDRVNGILATAFEGIDLHVSAGVYHAGQQDTAGTVFVCSDRALYAAKAKGKNTWCLYEKQV